MTLTLLIVGGVFVYAVMTGVTYRVACRLRPPSMKTQYGEHTKDDEKQFWCAALWPFTLFAILPCMAASGTLHRKEIES